MVTNYSVQRGYNPLPIFSEAKISCFLNITSDNKNNYIVEPEPLFREKFKKIKKNSKIISIQEISPSSIKKFNPDTSKKELQLLGKAKVDKNGQSLLDRYIIGKLPKTKVKLKIKNKNKISDIFLNLEILKKLKTLQFNLMKDY